MARYYRSGSPGTVLAASFVALTILSVPARAQSPADIERANQQSERIQREQQLRQQEDIERGLQSAHPETHIEVAPVRTPTGHGEGCRDIRTIVIEQAQHMSERQKNDFIRPYAGHCLGVDEIQRLLGDITNFYVSRGYATTRVYLPTQDLSTGTLRIRVIEGRISVIQLQKGDNGSASIATAFPFTTGAVLNLRDIEQGLDQINRLQSNNATMDIQPGAKVGESVIVIKNQPGKRWHVNMTADDYGDRSTGRNQVGATVSLDDILGLNESYSLTQRKTLPFNHDTSQSSSTSGTISVPFGYTTATVGYSGSDYDSTANTAGGQALHLNGTNRNLFVTLDHVWYRDQDGKATVSATLTRKSANNYFAGQLLGVSSRTLTILDLSSAYSTALLGGSANLSGTYSRGLRLLGGLKDADDLPGQAPHAQFDKFSISAGWLRSFEVAKENLSFSTQFTGQYALNPLYGSEQISVGGLYSVRGFYRETLANDNGYYVRNDLTLRHRLNDTMWGQPVTLSPYVAVDFGSVGSGKVPGTAHGTLVGGAIGLGLSVGTFSFDIYGGRPITAPKNIMDGEGYNTFARLAINF